MKKQLLVLLTLGILVPICGRGETEEGLSEMPGAHLDDITELTNHETEAQKKERERQERDKDGGAKGSTQSGSGASVEQVPVTTGYPVVAPKGDGSGKEDTSEADRYEQDGDQTEQDWQAKINEDPAAEAQRKRREILESVYDTPEAIQKRLKELSGTILKGKMVKFLARLKVLGNKKLVQDIEELMPATQEDYDILAAKLKKDSGQVAGRMARFKSWVSRSTQKIDVAYNKAKLFVRSIVFRRGKDQFPMKVEEAALMEETDVDNIFGLLPVAPLKSGTRVLNPNTGEFEYKSFDSMSKNQLLDALDIVKSEMKKHFTPDEITNMSDEDLKKMLNENFDVLAKKLEKDLAAKRQARLDRQQVEARKIEDEGSTVGDNKVYKPFEEMTLEEKQEVAQSLWRSREANELRNPITVDTISKMNDEQLVDYLKKYAGPTKRGENAPNIPVKDESGVIKYVSRDEVLGNLNDSTDV